MVFKNMNILFVVLFFLLSATSAELTMAELQPLPTSYMTYHRGDPYTTVYSPTQIPPPQNASTPKIEISSLANGTTYTSNNLTLTFTLTMQSTNSQIPITLRDLYYKASWQPNNTTIGGQPNAPFINKTENFTFNLTNVPEGNNSITVYSSILCHYQTGTERYSRPNTPKSIIVWEFLNVKSNYYLLDGNSTVDFIVDTTPKPPSPSPTAPQAAFTSENVSVAIVVAVTVLAVIASSVILWLKKMSKRKKSPL